MGENNESIVAASFYRMKTTLDYIESPVIRVLHGDVNKLPILQELSTRGCFQLLLSDQFVELNREVFEQSKQFLDLDDNHELKKQHVIREGSLNGYHDYGGLSKYNENRCGFIFENEDVLDLLGEGIEGNFVSKITQWREDFHNLARVILSRLANELNLLPSSEPQERDYNDYFDREFGFFNRGQLHMKLCRNCVNDPTNQVRLLAHTDPSLLSLVVHDRRGDRIYEGAMGLEINHRVRRQFERIPAGGWRVVTVFAGDILARVSNRLIHAPLHRVASTLEDPIRLAGTIFIQPAMEAKLRCFPTQSGDETMTKKKKSEKEDLTYAAWKQQKYGKYFKKS